MAQQTISTGTSANDGTGDTLRSAGTKINQNFTEVYGLFPTRVSETVTTGTLADSADGNISFSNLGFSNGVAAFGGLGFAAVDGANRTSGRIQINSAASGQINVTNLSSTTAQTISFIVMPHHGAAFY